MQNEDRLKESVITIASELFRFRKVFEKVIAKISTNEQQKYLSQYEWFNKKVETVLNELDIKIVSVEGQSYDPGVPAIPLNIDDFDANDELVVEQMIEPIIMSDSKVAKTGTVILRRKK